MRCYGAPIILLSLTRGEDGVWTGDSNPQDEGFHTYRLVIDGARVPDPGSRFFYGAGRWGSGIEVPARDRDFSDLKVKPTTATQPDGLPVFTAQGKK